MSVSQSDEWAVRATHRVGGKEATEGLLYH